MPCNITLSHIQYLTRRVKYHIQYLSHIQYLALFSTSLPGKKIKLSPRTKKPVMILNKWFNHCGPGSGLYLESWQGRCENKRLGYETHKLRPHGFDTYIMVESGVCGPQVMQQWSNSALFKSRRTVGLVADSADFADFAGGFIGRTPTTVITSQVR